ncbi:MAG: alginate lyase family protein, partial [Sphingopyxis sp.]|nr:alginate lyase family protein [Sphingopyxis sp.]
MIPVRKALYPWALTVAAVGFAPAAAALSPPAPAAVCKGSDGYAESFGGRRTFALRPADLEAIKGRLASDPAVAAAYKALIARADKALAGKPASVMDKRSIPVSGDRHDYVSLAPYWWPDPAKPGGAYIRKDGQVNPDRDTNRFDRSALGRMVREADALALAYYYSGDAKDAAGAARGIRSWFLDP